MWAYACLAFISVLDVGDRIIADLQASSRAGQGRLNILGALVTGLNCTYRSDAAGIEGAVDMEQ